MIISYLMGGLGNQIFQWAYGKSLSIKYKQEHILDISFYENQVGVTPRKFELYGFPNLKTKIQNNVNNTIKICENGSHENSILINDGSDYLLYGYFQSELYFKEIQDQIMEDLEIPEDKKKELNNRYNFKKSVSIHVRRTDYLTSGGFHPIQPIEYYKNALNYIDYEGILVFSDDLEWCKNNLDFPKMQIVEGNSNIEDMWIMSMCDNNIIANSSFSWWGAWLNKNRQKKVVVPRNWFRDYSNSSIYNKDWIVI